MQVIVMYFWVVVEWLGGRTVQISVPFPPHVPICLRFFFRSVARRLSSGGELGTSSISASAARFCVSCIYRCPLRSLLRFNRSHQFHVVGIRRPHDPNNLGAKEPRRSLGRVQTRPSATFLAGEKVAFCSVHLTKSWKRALQHASTYTEVVYSQ